MPQEPKKPIEEIVEELDRYPIDAFALVQECIGVASEQVHGPMSEAEKRVAQWMGQHGVDLDELRSASELDSLPSEVAEALQDAGGPERMNRHVTGQQLCKAVRNVALQRWGLMARNVLTRWNITRTEDIGAIIFALVENDWLQKQPTDRIEDFEDAFSFDEAFSQAYRLEEG